MVASIYLQAVQVTASVISSILAATALIYSMSAYANSLKTAQYNELDRSYASLLTLAFHSPYLIKPKEITSPEQKEKYEIYAFMVWNFLEAIYDKCLKDDCLKETWFPIIEVEGKLHSDWFLREENKPKFKDIFYKHIIETVSL